MQIILNGERHDHLGEGTPSALLKELGAHPDHTALTVNGSLIFSKDWNTFTLNPDDTVEVLTFVGGG